MKIVYKKLKKKKIKGKMIFTEENEGNEENEEHEEHKETKEKIPFFNLGPKNDWKRLLDLEIIIKIEKAFEKEMKELGYL